MPRKVQPQWGRQGMVRLRGWGLTDRELDDLSRTLGTTGRPDRGLLHSDEEIRVLAAHLGFPSGSELSYPIRSRLDFIRGFYVKGQRQEALVPPQRERNSALAAVLARIEAFLAAIKALTPLPNWTLVDLLETDDLTPSPAFLTLPHRLRLVAAMSRTASRDCARVSSDSDSLASVLWQIAVSADQLADRLLVLDFSSLDDVLKHLPMDTDYAMNTLSGVLAVSIRLSTAVDAAWKAGRRSPGPRPNRELKQTIFWLCDLFEQCVGSATHTPREKTHYDGRPHSPAGRFVLDFMKMCADGVRPHTISSFMTEVVKMRSGKPGKMARGGSF